MQRIKASNLNRGLVGAWCPSIAGNGLLLPDLSGYGNHGTLQNMDASDWVGTDKGRALDFDGSDDCLNISPIAFATQFAFTAWVRRFGFLNNMLFGESSGNMFGGKKIGFDGSDFFARIVTFSSTVAFPTSGINFLCFQRNAENKVDLYINNNAGQRLYSDSAQIGTYTLSRLAANGGANDQNFAGYVLDVRTYNRVLSPSEIKQLYEGGPGYGLRQERKRSRFQVQGFNAGRFRRQQLIGSGVY